MKPVFTALLLLFCSIAFTQDQKMKNAKAKSDKKETKVKAEYSSEQLDMPYTAEYSSKFMPGNPAHGKLILDIWKDWDDNVTDRHADMFADTVFMMFPNGQSVKGRDSAMYLAKKFRGSLASSKSTIEAWMPTKSIDRNEDWVLVWGREEDTDMNSNKTTVLLHEIWRINKDGKIDFMRQYMSKPTESASQ
ncbi:hypothetical protein OCK74_14450 [Chitinophagaceae bacterium LB-8]|uniref:Nuclear transport factor 2 family protein n=1 Tax=Paraflavisolibacter caeni TaxID=2982496 RepID=A0A9X2XP96_9BACT|nr:hypothetical protein [Paraflavisolibacter caeni]MCU7550319.1 hypothetical protein [Paraflavisolibacter caeni]